MGTTNAHALRTKKINGQNLTEEECLKEHEGLVWKASRKFTRITEKSSIDIEDLHAEGMYGLIKAYRDFDQSRGLRFSTYAYPKVFGEITTLIREHYHPIKYPREMQMQTLTKNPTPDGDVYRDNITSIYKKQYRNGMEYTIEETLFAYDDYTVIYVNDYLNRISKRRKRAILYRLHGYSQQEIATFMNMSQVSVSRLIRGAVS